jgi:hypothetical protein
MRAVLRVVKNILFVVTFLPLLHRLIKYTKYSTRGILDVPLFGYAWLIEQLAFHVGEWASIFEIIKKEEIIKKRNLKL